MRCWSAAVGLVTFVVALGCGMPVLSEEGQLIAGIQDFGNVLTCPGTPPPVLVGAEVAFKVSCHADCPAEHDAMACFSTDLDPAEGPPGTYRYRFDHVGPAVWRFDAVPCAANAAGYRPVDDRFVFDVVGPDDVVGRAGEPEVFAETLLSAGPRRSFPADWRQPEGEPWQVVIDRPVGFAPVLVTDRGLPVGAPYAAPRFTIEQARGRPAEMAMSERGTVLVIPKEVGAEATVWFSHPAVPDDRWPLATVVGVAEDTVASLEVVAAYAPTGTHGVPLAARAVARDASGDLVWGAPISWSIEGEGLALEREAGGVGVDHVPTDYANIGVEEVAQTAGSHRGRITASLGGLTAATELTWTVAEGAPPWPDWQAPLWYCPKATQRGAIPAAPVLMGLLSLVVCGGIVWWFAVPHPVRPV
jgi:hypothetical protein